MPKKYSEKSLLDAVEEVRQGTLSLRKSSAKYGVPVMTIQDRVRGKVDDIVARGRPTVLPDTVEDHLASKLKEASLKGFGITRRMLAIQVGRLVRRLKMKTPFRNGVPGKDWVTGFLKRHPDLTVRTPTALSTVRARMLNPTVSRKYFSDLNEIYQQYSISDKPHLIWNIDETSVPLTHKPSKVIAETGVKNVPGRVGNNRENISVLACVNAAGRDIPPFVIVRGKTQKSLYAYNSSEGVPGSVYTYQERAWMEDTLGELWFKSHFLKHCGKERPQVILLDSHSSNETLGLIESARQNNIILLAFPPHTTQWLCPLDKSVFGPLLREYNRVCSEFMSVNPNHLVTKWEWPRLFRLAYERAFSRSNVTSGFRKCGIFPFCPSAIPNHATAPSAPYEYRPPETTSSSTISSLSLLPEVAAAPLTPVENIVPSLPLVPESSVPVRPSLPSSAKLVSETSIQHSPTTIETEQLTPVSKSLQVDSPYTIVSEQEFIGSVLSGDVDFTTDEHGNLHIQLPVGGADVSMGFSVGDILSENIASSSSTMIDEIDNILDLPPPKREQKINPRKLTSHRILTSDEIYKQKCEVKERKEKELKLKEERKQARLLKAKSKSK